MAVSGLEVIQKSRPSLVKEGIVENLDNMNDLIDKLGKVEINDELILHDPEQLKHPLQNA